MMLELFVTGLLTAQVIDVEVRNGSNAHPIGSAEVVIEGSDPPQPPRNTRANGRARFNVVCSEDIKFRARLRDEPHFLNPSPYGSCAPPVVVLKLWPTD